MKHRGIDLDPDKFDPKLVQLEQDLHELEQTDPVVKRARKKLDAATDELTSEYGKWRTNMVRSIWGDNT